MEIDKDFIKVKVMTIPGLREAMREGNYDEVFRLCGSPKKRMQLAEALTISGVKFLDKMTEIPDSLFRGSEAIGSLEIPANIKKIGHMAFFGSTLT